MVLSKLDLALVIMLAAAALGLERAHRVVIGSMAAAAAPALGSVCPDTDDAPFSADCVKFIDGGALPAGGIHTSARSLFTSTSVGEGGAGLRASPCPPSNENAPYSARCLRFLSGAAWHP